MIKEYDRVSCSRKRNNSYTYIYKDSEFKLYTYLRYLKRTTKDNNFERRKIHKRKCLKIASTLILIHSRAGLPPYKINWDNV